MLAKLTSKNQLTIPAALLRQVSRAEYFDATVDGGAIVLRPVQMLPAIDLEQIRAAIAAAGATEADVALAVKWSRSPER